jgi:hypothetical protein
MGPIANSRTGSILITVLCLCLITILIVRSYVKDTVFVAGDGSTNGSTVYIDGVRVGKMEAAAGKLARMPSTTGREWVTGAPWDSVWLVPDSGYAECRFKLDLGMHRMEVVGARGETLRTDLEVRDGAIARVSFKCMAIQVFTGS